MAERSDSKLFDLFDEAMEMEGEARHAFLVELAHNSPEDAARIETLIQQFEESRSFFEEPLMPRFVDVLTSDEEDHFEGRRLASYRLMKPLGQGGMGSVWLGVRDDGTHNREVAIKMLTRVHVKDFRRRFQKEQQILAGLRHPNIACLYDSGITEDNIPFYIMEYVRGERLDVYASNRQLDLNSRLRLFQKVCQAVNFAHQNLVVHRDLKPQNIMVTEDGEPMLLDFGIAKLLETDGDMTETGLRPMTREYASPEQIKGLPINITSDIYSLGVILYELLTGSRPHVSDTGTPFDLERMILEVEPSRPSDYVSGKTGESLTGITGSDNPYQYRKALAGELDAIVLMALQKEPDQRYNSAQQFAEDIEAFLTDKPIRARKATTMRLAYKFVRRNLLATATVFAFILALLAMLAVTMRQRDEAERARINAEKITYVLLDFLDISDPFQHDAKKIPIADLLDHGARQLKNLEQQPEVASTLMLAMAKLYYRLGDMGSSKAMCESAIKLYNESPRKDLMKLSKCYLMLSSLYIAESQWDPAERHIKDAVAIREDLLDRYDLRLAEAYHAYGNLLLFKGALEESEDYLERTLEIKTHVLPEYSEEIASTYVSLGQLLRTRGRLEESGAAYARVAEIREVVFGREHPTTAHSYYFIGLNHDFMGKRAVAFDYYERAYSIFSRKLTPEHPTSRLILRDFVSAHCKLGRFEAAKALISENYAKDDLLVKPHLGRVLRESDELWSAFDLLCDIEERLQKSGQGQSYEMAINYRDLGRTAAALNRYHMATFYYQKALGILHRNGFQSVTAVAIATEYGNVLVLNADDEACGFLEQSLQATVERVGEQHYLSADNHLQLGKFYRNQGSPELAGHWFRKANEFYQRTPDLPASGEALAVWGHNMVILGYQEEGLSALQKAVAGVANRPGAHNVRQAAYQVLLIEALLHARKLREAEQYLHDFRNIYSALHPERAVYFEINYLELVSRLLALEGDHDGSMAYDTWASIIGGESLHSSR